VKTIAITGGTGLVGSHLVPLLLARGHRVRLLTRRGGEARPGVQIVPGSLLSEPSLDALTDGADAILHMAYSEPGTTSAQDRSATQVWFDENLLGTVRLLERTARVRDKRLVYTSSLAVFSRDPNLDPRGHGIRRDEECALLPLEFYGSLRAACEPLLRTAAHAYGFRTSIWRLGCVLGLREPWDTTPLWPIVNEAISTGEVRTPFGAYAIAVEDAAAILADALEDDQVQGETFHVFDRWIDHAEVARIVSQSLHRRIESAHPPAPEPISPIIGSKIRARHPVFSTERCLAKLVDQLVTLGTAARS
jgi:nucleoside-diphosphate-sugar epimerase